MDNLMSVPVTDPSNFLKQQAKASLTQDMDLDKAAELTAERNALLTNQDIPDALKRAQLQQVNRQVRTWTKKVRDPFGSDDDTVIKAFIKAIKSPEDSTPVIPKRSPTQKDTAPVARKKDVAKKWLDF